jgi:hypothetical protein
MAMKWVVGCCSLLTRKKKKKGTKTKKQVRLTEEFFRVFVIKKKTDNGSLEGIFVFVPW